MPPRGAGRGRRNPAGRGRRSDRNGGPVPDRPATGKAVSSVHVPLSDVDLRGRMGPVRPGGDRQRRERCSDRRVAAGCGGGVQRGRADARDRDRRWADPRRPAVPRVRRRRRGARPHGPDYGGPPCKGDCTGTATSKRSRPGQPPTRLPERAASTPTPGGSSTRPRAAIKERFPTWPSSPVALGPASLPREHLQPELVIIGGGFADAGESILVRRGKRWRSKGFLLREVVRIVLAELGHEVDGGRRTRRFETRSTPHSSCLSRHTRCFWPAITRPELASSHQGCPACLRRSATSGLVPRPTSGAALPEEVPMPLAVCAT